jgi:hypothetical protein
LFGGGIYNEAGTTTVDDTAIMANTALTGGGILNDGGTLTVQNGSMIGQLGAGNSAGSGGGIHNWDGGVVTVDGSSVISNTATASGGGVYNGATLTVTNGSAIRGNAAAGTLREEDGGGIYNEAGATATVDGSSVISNTARWGGGISNRGTLTVTNASTVSANACSGAMCFGGGVYNRGTLTVDSSALISNVATADGGGILNAMDSTTTVTGSRILNNTASWWGGGIYNDIDGTVTVDDSTVSGNAAKEVGGGIYNFGTTTVTGSRILNNTATTNGGGVYNREDVVGATRVTGSCIVGNSDTSVFNDQPAELIATANWWGAATGPNSPGADTVDGNVDTGGYLTVPILGCTPDLRVSKANDTGGEVTAGTPFHWTLTISNTGITHGVFSAGQAILVDDLPAGPTYGVPTVADPVNVTGGVNIDCGIVENRLLCEAGGEGVTVGAAGRFTVAFSVTAGEGGALSNPAGVCRVDPEGSVTEGDENNDCPTDTVNVEVALRSIYLPLVMRNAGAP